MRKLRDMVWEQLRNGAERDLRIDTDFSRGISIVKDMFRGARVQNGISCARSEISSTRRVRYCSIRNPPLKGVSVGLEGHIAPPHTRK